MYKSRADGGFQSVTKVLEPRTRLQLEREGGRLKDRTLSSVEKLSRIGSLPICSNGESLIHTSGYRKLQIAEVLLHNNKGISKCHKMGEKETILRNHVSQSIFGIFRNKIPLNPAPFQKCGGIIQNLNVERETCTTVF